jgi:hypothetical protein
VPSLQSARGPAAGSPSRSARQDRRELQPQGNAAAQEALRATQGGLPPDLLADMESSFGVDFGDVRVHEDGAAGAIGALAYTRGDDLHFAPGRFDPESARGRELIGHELAHVVQQRAGRVGDAPLQAKGLPVQPDGGLESEADAMGKIAADGGQARMPGAGGEGGSPDVAQCAFGLEMELNNFYVKPEEGKALPTKRDPLVTTEHGLIELQAENAAQDRNVEFVTKKGGLEGTGEVDTALTDFAGVMKNMQGARHGEELPTSGLGSGSPGDRTLLAQSVSPSAAATHGEFMDIMEGKPNLPNGSIQATMGIPLAKVPALFTEYAKVADRNPETLTGAVKDAAAADVPDASPDFRGLLTLVNHVVRSGESQQNEQFPKATVQVLNRTDFRTMLLMLPEITKGGADPNEVAAALLKAVPADPKRRVFQQTFKVQDKQEKPYRITLTIRDWLLGLPKGDLLQQPPIEYVGEEGEDAGTRATNFGGLGKKTDDVDGTESPVLELRTPKAPNFGNDGRSNTGAWLERAYELYGLHERVLGHEEPDAHDKASAILDRVYPEKDAPQDDLVELTRVPLDEGSSEGSSRASKKKGCECIIV